LAAIVNNRKESPSQPWWRLLGPGLITGAADDDPSGIATYAQAGAQFGFKLGWTLLLTYPLMVAIQTISARIGRTTGLGLAGNMRSHYSKTCVGAIVGILCIANVLNLGADLGAMAEAAHLLLPVWPAAYVVVFAVFCTVCQVYFHHARYVAILKWLTLSLLAYLGTVCVVHIQWQDLMLGLVWPRLTFDRQFWAVVVAILGTTISPYLFFWQAAQEVEDTKAHPERKPLIGAPTQVASALARIRVDTLVGMAVSNLVALAILVTSAATLHAGGIRQIDSAAQAAEALRPLAGNFAFTLFALGIISTGLISVPVLAGSAAYALGEARRWPVGLSNKPRQARAFYGAIAVATILGALENTFGIAPLRALLWAAILNGIAAVPIMILVMLMAANYRVMGSVRISRRLKIAGWGATGVMAAASVVFFFTLA
jgi:NRAMP (natural resistance-associated macrophage protein)-like metal ion transporter